MNKNISIYIPEPCHQDWQQMTPADKGRFCQSCAKQVVDFSMMTDQQVLNFISKAPGRVCGRFADDQLQRPLQPVRQEKKKIWWMAAVLPLAMVFARAAAQKKISRQAPVQNIIRLKENIGSLGIVVFTTSDKPSDDAENDAPENATNNFNDTPSVSTSITVWRKKGQSSFTVTGKIEEDKSNKPIGYATIKIKGTKTATGADANGNFTLTGSTTDNSFTLVVSAVGYLNKEQDISLKDTDEAPVPASYQISGRVIDMSGMAIRFATVTIKGSKQFTKTGDNGTFNLTLPPTDEKKLLVVSSVGYEDKEIPASTTDTGMIIKCNAIISGLTQITVTSGKTFFCDKPKQTDTIKTAVLKVFNLETFKIFPNPARAGQNITVDTKKEGGFSIQLFDNTGKLLQVKEFDAAQGTTQTQLPVPSTYTPGIYYIRLIDNSTKKQVTGKIVVM